MTRTVFENAIEADGLVKRYGEVQALDGVDLQVEAGTVFGLLGPNGAGKSTTVRILTTLSRPDAGAVRVAGIDALARPVDVRRVIGVVAQKHGTDPDATGRENLVLQAELYGVPRTRADELLERFGLADAADRQAKTYSGGMIRRLDVALGLINRPQVLFLDEPTTGLDPEARATMWAEIDRLAREERITILLTTHYLEEADRLASQLAIVDRGKIVARGTPDELKSELQGDAVQVELSGEDEAAARTALERVAGLADVLVEGRTLHARAANGAAAIPAVLAALDAHGVRAASVTLARPSLDDVYLKHAGRAYAA
jgi:ABC-2 type transport system ATP-binding protein